MYKASVFQKTYEDYLERIGSVDLRKISGILGCVVKDNEIIIPFFGRPYSVSSKGIFDDLGDRADFNTVVVLSKYILLSPDNPIRDSEPVLYRDFKNSAPLITYFDTNASGAIAEYFSNGLEELKTAGERLGGCLSDKIDADYDLILEFAPLPKIPLFMLYNDADEVFPAKCSLLFEKSAEGYLDAECLAIIGALLFIFLKKEAESAEHVN